MESSTKQRPDPFPPDGRVKSENRPSCSRLKDSGNTTIADPSAVKTEGRSHGYEAMDTNNNNNCEKQLETRANSTFAPGKSRSERTASSHTKVMESAQHNDPLLSHSAGPGRQSEQGGNRTHSGRIWNLGPSPLGLVSPDFPSLCPGTPASVSQLFNLPSSAFSLDGLEFSSPLGSGCMSPLASARLGRKRALSSISPLSASSLDFNNLIRTSPTSLVNYIANSRGSSAGSMGHLSPSLFTNPSLFQPPYNRPLFSLRNAAHPQLNMTFALGSQNSGTGASQSEPLRIKAEENYEPNLQHEEADNSSLQGSLKHETSESENEGLSLESVNPRPLETLPEEGASSEDEGMQTDQAGSYSSAITTETESELEAKLGLRDVKPKRIYYSYPSIEEPHNNRCQWGDCDRQCGSLEDLVRHVNSDHIYRDSKKDFVCHWVGCVREKRPFKAQYMLLVHMRRHTGEKPHKCTYEDCNKAYSRLENLKTHLRSHTGERPYLCKYEGCGKAFSNASDCAKHMNRTHSDEKPYACPNPGCMKRYTDPSSRRKHMKNCQANKRARTEERDAMSGADEESATEASNRPPPSTSRKNSKSKKSEKKKATASKEGPLRMKPHPMSGIDHGYVSGGSQGYMSSQATTGYNSSGYETEYPGLRGEEDLTRFFQQQSIRDPSLTYPPARGQYPASLSLSSPNQMPPSSHVIGHMTPNAKASRQKGGALMMPAGRSVHPSIPHPTLHHPHPQPQPRSHRYLSQSRHTQFPLSYPSCQSGLSSYPLQLSQEPHLASATHYILPTGINNENSPPFNAHHHPTLNYSANFAAQKTRETASSGYYTSSQKSPSDDGSVVSSSLRSSLLTNSYSTFSSNSSRVSSPCSNSGQSDALRPHPHSPLSQYLTLKAPVAPQGEAEFPLQHSLRMNPDEHSERSWQTYSSHSSRYSYSTRSELSDDLLESLPSTSRRNSFSKSQPLPLPDSMQRQFTVKTDVSNPVGIGMEYDPHNGNTSYGNQPSPMQLGVNDIHNPASDHLSATMPLHHFDVSSNLPLSYHGDLFSQGLTADGYDAFPNPYYENSRPMSPNMVVGDMATFTNVLPDETNYLESLLSSHMK